MGLVVTVTIFLMEGRHLFDIRAGFAQVIERSIEIGEGC